ncbi:MAG: hypothetical protein ABSE45_13510 [Candidatus Acidiferrales bacterium]
MSALLVELRGRIERTIQSGEVGGVPREDVTSFLSGAVKLYAAFVEDTETEVAAIDATVSTTEAMVVACALLRAEHLTPFDLALWFSRTARSPRGDASGA